MPVNWDDFRFFLAVARSGRLSAAGKQLGVDHATVGRRIKSLEDGLETTLFDRSPRGYVINDEGLRILQIAQSMESSSIAAQVESGELQKSLSGVVRIGASEGVASYMLAQCAAQICRDYPALELQIVALPQRFSLSKREADIAIGVSPPASGRLKIRKIADYKLHLYATKKYLSRHETITSIADLKRVRGIAYVQDLIYDKQLDYLPLISPEIKPHLTSTSVHVQLAATLADAGVCILHDFMTGPHKQLVKVLPNEVSFTRSFWYMVHEDYAKLERIRIVSDAIISYIRKYLN